MRIPLCLKIALVAILLFLSVASYAQQQRIVINEVMYAPISPEPEWVELYNADTITFNLKNWHISDRITTIKLPSIILTPGSYLLVTKDSNALKAKYSLSDVAIIQGKLPTYNNDGDQVILSDSLNNTIDSFEYNVDWGGGGGGLSLERYDVFAKSDSIKFFIICCRFRCHSRLAKLHETSRYRYFSFKDRGNFISNERSNIKTDYSKPRARSCISNSLQANKKKTNTASCYWDNYYIC